MDENSEKKVSFSRILGLLLLTYVLAIVYDPLLLDRTIKSSICENEISLLDSFRANESLPV